MQIYAVNYFKLNCHLTKCFQKCNWDIALDKSSGREIMQDYFFFSSIHLHQLHTKPYFSCIANVDGIVGRRQKGSL